MTKLNQLHLANELAIHNFKHQNFKDTQTLNFGQAKNENKINTIIIMEDNLTIWTRKVMQ